MSYLTNNPARMYSEGPPDPYSQQQQQQQQQGGYGGNYRGNYGGGGGMGGSHHPANSGGGGGGGGYYATPMEYGRGGYSSPAGGGAHAAHTPTAASKYLPNRLFPTGQQPGSHDRGTRRTPPSTLAPPLQLTSPRQSVQRQRSADRRLSDTRHQHSRSRPKDMAGEPPIEGLFQQHAVPTGTSDFAPMRPQQDPYGAPVGRSSLNPSSPMGHVNNFSGSSFPTPQNGRDHSAAEKCVTVFGFAPGDASYILSEFEQYGVVVRRKHDMQSNWMHLEYSTKIQAQKALSKNGHAYAGKIMVGVCPCENVEFVGGETKPNNAVGVMGTPTPRKLVRNSKQQQQQRNSMVSASSPSSRAPTMNKGVLSMAGEYIFGW